MNTSAHPWLARATGGSTAKHDAATLPRSGHTLLARCATRWPLWLALLALSGLLLAFAHVVRENVRQGDLRRSAVAAHADDLWRCNLISHRARRDNCRALLNPAPTEALGTPAPAADPLRP
jgi:hypothetical protein